MNPLYQNGDCRRLLTSAASPAVPYRSEFRRDYGRLLHSAPFRRLQGKTQLFPGNDSDFFRNRLTHSLEVAQVAKCVALRLNATEPFFALPSRKIDLDLVEFAALAHDLGHPPFGHNGEESLNDMMFDAGGFEGNAQTLRILTELTKKVEGHLPHSKDLRSFGLNITMRGLAAVLKYDNCIPIKIPKHKYKGSTKADSVYGVVKGYYSSEANIVAIVKASVLGKRKVDKELSGKKFRTLECSIMDLADDIAYSTYDLEDAFKAEFINPLDLIIVEGAVADVVLEKVNKALTQQNCKKTDTREMLNVLRSLVLTLFAKNFNDVQSLPADLSAALIQSRARTAIRSNVLRTPMTSRLIERFVNAVKVETNEKCPALSYAYLPRSTLLEVEALKNLTFNLITVSHRLRIVKNRGKEIVRSIFQCIEDDPALMPDDFMQKHKASVERARPDVAKRVICDFIAGMTDPYAIEYYARLKSEEHRTIFKPM